jgi:hypothetical protein
MAKALKSQDVLLALRLAVRPAPATQAEIADAIGICPANVNHGLVRLAASRLYNVHDRRVVRANLLEFLVSGLKYVFPAQLGLFGEGMPTAHSANPLARLIRATGSDDGAVWPSIIPNAPRARGHVVEPIHETAPQAAAKDPALHEMLALVDAVRVGRARERKLASDELEKRLTA